MFVQLNGVQWCPAQIVEPSNPNDLLEFETISSSDGPCFSLPLMITISMHLPCKFCLVLQELTWTLSSAVFTLEETVMSTTLFKRFPLWSK
ncbi:hypothetical protein H5410_034539 [Solanum commersonii]|uniref:Uncharacterized protein n=1 Tax=Solanum commersonii TaxID=4109 RepID=A0A9J5YRN8_SOLCO|nr:hypothetical protein H5410_034539 [Solanum commersonii]